MSEPIIKISREADDPICIRVSMGGWLEQGLYCVYRLSPGASKEDVIAIVSAVLEALQKNDWT